MVQLGKNIKRHGHEFQVSGRMIFTPTPIDDGPQISCCHVYSLWQDGALKQTTLVKAALFYVEALNLLHATSVHYGHAQTDHIPYGIFHVLLNCKGGPGI